MVVRGDRLLDAAILRNVVVDTPDSLRADMTYRAGVEALDTAMVRIPGAGHGITRRPSNLVRKVAYNAETQINVQTQISDVRDVDMAEAILRLKSAETSYEATLSAAGRSLSRSLLDFLR